MAVQRKRKIRAIRTQSVANEFTLAERRELRRRYKEAHEHPRLIADLRALPNPFAADSEDEGNGQVERYSRKSTSR